ncbi:hypothetical protein HK100_010500, partial [Physocladia obscura]
FLTATASSSETPVNITRSSTHFKSHAKTQENFFLPSVKVQPDHDNFETIFSSSPSTKLDLTHSISPPANEKSRILFETAVKRAEYETADLLTTGVARHNDLAQEVAHHLSSIQKFMASQLRTNAATAAVLGGEFDRIAAAERKAKIEELDRSRRAQEEWTLKEHERREMVEKQQKTGEGRRRLAVIEGGTGDIAMGFLTRRADFRPVPTFCGTHGKISDSVKVIEKSGNDEEFTNEQEAEKEENDNNDGIIGALEQKIEIIKQEIDQKAMELTAGESGRKNKENMSLTSPQISQDIPKIRQQSKFVTVDSSSLLISRGVSAAIVRRSSGKAGPRVPLDIAAIWKAKENGKFEADDASPRNSNIIHQKKRLDPDFFESSSTVCIKQVLQTQKNRNDELAMQVLSPFHQYNEYSQQHIPLIAQSAENMSAITNKTQKYIDENSKNFCDTPCEIRKCNPPPQKVIYEFAHTSARLLDARNRRINPAISSHVIQPKLYIKNLQSLKIQSSVHNISQPPTFSVKTLAATSKAANACMKSQFKLAPTLSLEHSTRGKVNPEVELPKRILKGRLGDVFGLKSNQRVDKKMSASDFILNGLNKML